jgi:trimeric autotransporter adhesin
MLLLMQVLTPVLCAQPGIITTIAGKTGPDGQPTRGFEGDGGPAARAALALANLQNKCPPPTPFEQTSHISIDGKGNIYFADSENQRIRRIDPAGNISTVAGDGAAPASNSRCEPTSPVGDGGSAASAHLFNPADVLPLPDGSILIADQQNNRIRQIANGTIATIAGNGLHNFFSPGNPATASPMDWPSALAVDSAGLIYFSELHGNRVGRINRDGKLATVAGNGFPGNDTLTKPAGIAIDRDGNVLIADTGNHRIRKATPSGALTTIAGNGQQGFCGDNGPAASACFDTPMDVQSDSRGNIYVADTGNHRVRRIDPAGMISTIAGTGQPGRGPDNVAATSSALNNPSALALDAYNDLYIIDWQNYLIRKVTFAAIFAGGVVEGAGFSGVPSPGGIFSVFGASLAASAAAANGAPLPTQLAGVGLEVNGTAVPLYLVSPGQINAQLPYEAAPGPATASIVTSAGRGPPASFVIAPAAPGVFIALNQNNSVNKGGNPESRGRVLICYVTGLGAVSPPVPTGQSAPLDVLSSANARVNVTVAGVAAQVRFAGLAPGFAGLGQINVLVPQESAAGDAVPLVIEINGQKSQSFAVSIR